MFETIPKIGPFLHRQASLTTNGFINLIIIVKAGFGTQCAIVPPLYHCVPPLYQNSKCNAHSVITQLPQQQQEGLIRRH